MDVCLPRHEDAGAHDVVRGESHNVVPAEWDLTFALHQ